MSIKQSVQVKNDLGLHTRPATIVVKLLQNCKSQVTFTYKKNTINAKSIMSILMLAARKHAKIMITAEGEDAPQIVKQLVDVFDDGFGE
jgi:phosphocarrier protein